MSDGATSQEPADRVEQLQRQIRQLQEQREQERRAGRQALQAGEDRYRALAESAGEAISIVDPEGRFVYVNEVAARRLGKTAEEIVGRHMRDLFPPPHADRQWGTIAQVLQAGKGRTVESWTHVLGQDCCYRTSVYPLDGSQGVVIVARDITQTRLARESQQRVDQWLRLVLQHSTDGINVAEYDPATYRRRLVLCNDRYVQMSGRSLQELTEAEDLNRFVRVHRAQPGQDQEHFRCLREGRPYGGRASWIRPDGKENVHEWSAAPVRIGDKLYIVGIDRDITERRRQEEALRQSEERYRGLVESQNDLIVRVTPDGRFTFVNDAYCRVFGRRREELLGRTYMPLVHPDDLPATLAAVKGLEALPYRRQVAQRAMTAMGWRWIEWEDYAIRDPQGATVEIQAVGRDITQRKLTEQTLQALHQQLMNTREDERRRLARDLHDSIGQRTIAMSYALQTVMDDLGQAPEGLLSAQRHCNDLIRETRAICHGLYPPTLESLGLPAALRQVADDCRQAGVRTRVNIAKGLARRRFPDEIEIALFRITQEALHNALRHGKPAAVSVSLAVMGKTLRLTVRDNGCGFDPAVNSGKGLGLNTMRERARAIGGELEVTSRPGRTQVVVRAPLRNELLDVME